MDAVDRFLDRRAALLARLETLLHDVSSPRDAAWIVCEYTGRELNLADCVVYLPEGSDLLVQEAGWGSRRGVKRQPESRLRLAFGRGIVGDTARRQETQRVDDTRNDPRFVRDVDPSLSELAVPICHDGILLGVLDSEDHGTGFYDPRYEEAFEAIAHASAAHFWRLRR